jgi:tetratricopeptide (TPR) repeat protein
LRLIGKLPSTLRREVYLAVAICFSNSKLLPTLRMTSFVFGNALRYTGYLQRGALSSAPDVAIGSDIASVLGSSVPPPDWPVLPEPQVAPIDWDHSEELLDHPELNTPLSALKENAKTPDETSAAEHFDSARDALRSGRDREAFTSIQKSINGDESHAVQPQNFRAHFLLGIIRLGSFKHHDASLLDLDQAEHAFATAAQQALADFPESTARAYLAAGWSSYCQGRMDTAAQHTQQAILANSHLAEAHFQRAKIAMHQRAPDVAQTFLARAIQLNPGFAEAAFRDSDFVPFASVVVEVVKSVRDALGRQASKALHEANRRAGELDVDSGDPLPGSGTAASQSISRVIVLLRAAETGLTENTLHGNARTLAAVEAATSAIAVLRGQVKMEQVQAADAIQRGTEELARLTAINIGGYRLNASGQEELATVQARLDSAAKNLARANLHGYVESQAESDQALNLLQRARDGFLESALEHATSEYNAIERQIEDARRKHSDSGGAVKAFAVIGALVALFPGGVLNLFSLGSGAALRWSEVVMHLCIAVVIGGTLGALVGKLFSGNQAETAPMDNALEQRLATLRQTIADLRAEQKASV